jgi:glyoxylase-like metal-dependent hydrolase (beta-lactamase superfamily II)/mono/diheme cytochrome c family protein
MLLHVAASAVLALAAQVLPAQVLPAQTVLLGSPPARYSVADIAAVIAIHTVEVQCDPLFKRPLAFTGFRLRDVSKAFFKSEAGDTLVFTAIDGYESLLPRSAGSDPRALLAFSNAPDGASWLPAEGGGASVDPGPLYLVWEGASACDPSSHLPWPYQVDTIAIARRDALLAAIEPDSRNAPAAAVDGFETFQKHCLSCHRIWGVGGEVGPALVTSSGALTNYLPPETASAYILDAPSINPATKMPSFKDEIDSSTYEKLIAYIRWAGSKAAAGSAAPKPARPLDIERVKGDLYMISGEGGNVAVYVTGQGVILVDDMFYRNYDDILAKVRSVTDKPIVYVLNTHQHDDHAGGNAKMLAIANVIAQQNVRANLSDIKQPYYEDTPGTPIGLPNITFSDEIVLYLGGKEVRAKYFGRGHTNGDAVVYFPDLKVVHTGDLFLGRSRSAPPRGRIPATASSTRRDVARAPPAGAPGATEKPPGVNIYVDYAQGGSFLDWTGTLDGVLALDFDTVIPGHGPISSKDDVIKFRADLEAMRNRIAALIRAGASKQQVLTVFEMDYGWRSTGCPPSPPTPGCLQYQQMDALIEELTPR